MVGAISAGVVALYLLDRSKRRQLVATLRFWSAADVRTELKHRRRIQQPWSLLLQLISLALLLTAIAGPQLGIFDTAGRDHVIVLDTSAWMGRGLMRSEPGHPDGSGQSRCAGLPAQHSSPRPRDAGARRCLATPATAFESNRTVLESAIQQSQPGASALNLAQALEFADRAQKLQSQQRRRNRLRGRGTRVRRRSGPDRRCRPNLRVVTTSSTLENVGLRKIGLRRSPSAPDSWDIFVVVRNYGVRPQSVDLGLQFSKSPAGSEAADAASWHRGTGYLHLRRQDPAVFWKRG